MINRNRERDELERLRGYRDPDRGGDDDPEGDGDGDGGSPDREDYVRWFGLWVSVDNILRIGFGCMAAVVLLVFLMNIGYVIPWIRSDSPAYLWIYTAFIVPLCFISFSMFVAAKMKFRREMRETDARIARMDNATEDEVDEYVRTSEKRLNRRMRWRSLFIAGVVVVLMPTIGTPYLFPWGNILLFAVVAGLIIGAAFVWWYHREWLLDKLGLRRS